MARDPNVIGELFRIEFVCARWQGGDFLFGQA